LLYLRQGAKTSRALSAVVRVFAVEIATCKCDLIDQEVETFFQLGQKLQQSWKRGDIDSRIAQSPSSPTPPLDQSVPTSNFTTVAIFPLTPDIPK